ncbi:TATA-box binding [Desulfonispora thiosulfatigenes DSM 11270]|uniref:TATA-box binding n=1 Tax=Desulfonispora thiosulfatigenes DSM 11270 TaxID=656914 RepID=A0A1W1V4A9_DESTI|nr:YwmB family TATA-box binding protein [Desulfonispora thiosulfatigenes]SMB88229.1 TATA-box binding [Desulfonispora thiosulfatigenes DSM 11270]
MKAYSSVAAVIAIIITLIIPTYESSKVNSDYYDLAMQGFLKSDADLQVLNIQTWTKIRTGALTENELLDIHEEIISSLGLSSNPEIDNINPGFLNIFQKEKISEDIYVESSLQSLSNGEGESGTYLGILIFTKDFSTGRAYYDRIDTALSKLNIKSEIGITATGTYDGNLESSQSEKRIKEIFTAINAKSQEGINSEGLLSVSGYSEGCPDYLSVNGKKININIAMRYHSIDNQTYIHVGAPLIYEEY